MLPKARFGVFGGVVASVFAGMSAMAAPPAPPPPVTFGDMVHQRAIAALEGDAALKHSPEAILVRFKAGTPAASKDVVRQMIGGVKVREYGVVPGLEKLHTNIGVELAVRTLSQLPQVEYAEPDYVVHHTATPNDTYFGLQWGMLNSGQNVNGVVGTAGADSRATQAWDVFTGDPNFVIAVIDTGMQLNHPDLAANLYTNPGEIPGNGVDDDGNGYIDDVNGWNFYGANNNPGDSGGHGTHTAGTVGAVGNNGVGVTGMNWQCKIMPLKFLGPNGGYTSDAVLAVQYFTNKGVKVSNNSWGGGGYSQALYDAINASKSVGHVFVAAAGNGGSDQIGDNNDSIPHYPSNYNLDNIIAVAATDSRDARATFSNYGANSVDLGAPGVNIASTYINSNYVYNSGTSMACPHVAGVAALVYARNPGWTYQQVRSQILTTVRPAPSMANITTTGGILDAAAALGGGGGGPVNTAPTVSISSPGNGSGYSVGASITFSGSSSDTQDGNLSAGLIWTSSLQGQIGTGASFSRSDLVTGTHTVTASSTDSGGLVGTATVQIIITDPTSTPPTAPSGLSATNLNSGRARLNWSDNSNNETGFEIQRETGSGRNWTNLVTINVGANTTTYTDTPGRAKHRYRIRAVNAAGQSAWSGWVQVNVR